MSNNGALEALNASAAARKIARDWDATRIQPLRDAVRTLLSNPLLPSEATVRCFTDHLLLADLRDEVAQEIFVFKAIDYELSKFALAVIRPGHVTCDIGAHIGYHTHLLALGVGPQGRVLSFEPTPRTFIYLEKNTAWMPQVETFNIAVGENDDNLSFFDYGPELAAYNSRFGLRLDSSDVRVAQTPECLSVKQCRLDDFLANKAVRANYIKIDVESSEMQVLIGMEQILTEDKPTLAVEVGDFPHLLESGVATTLQIIDYLGTFGYRPFEFNHGYLEPHRVKAKQPYDYMNLFFLNIESYSPGREIVRS